METWLSLLDFDSTIISYGILYVFAKDFVVLVLLLSGMKSGSSSYRSSSLSLMFCVSGPATNNFSPLSIFELGTFKRLLLLLFVAITVEFLLYLVY